MKRAYKILIFLIVYFCLNIIQVNAEITEEFIFHLDTTRVRVSDDSLENKIGFSLDFNGNIETLPNDTEFSVYVTDCYLKDKYSRGGVAVTFTNHRGILNSNHLKGSINFEVEKNEKAGDYEGVTTVVFNVDDEDIFKTIFSDNKNFSQIREVYIREKVTETDLPDITFDPARYSLLEWRANGKKYDFKTNLTEETNFMAYFEPVPYEIDYKANNGKLANPIKTYDTETPSFTIPEPTRTNYEFLGYIGGKNRYISNEYTAMIYSYGIPVRPNYTNAFSYKINNESIKLTTLRSPQDGEQYSGLVTEKIILEPNTTYIFSADLEKGKNENRIAIYNIENDTYEINQYLSNKSGHIEQVFTTDDTGVIAMMFGIRNVNIGDTTTFENIQIEKGIYFTGFESYIKIPTRNIFIQEGTIGHRIYEAKWIKNADGRTDTTYVNKRDLIGGYSSYGLKEYEYYYSDTKVEDESTIIPMGTTNKTISFSQSGEYHLYYRAIDEMGNKTNWKREKIRVDVDKPEADFRVIQEGNKHYIVIDTLDVLSDMNHITNIETTTNASTREIPLKIYATNAANRPSETWIQNSFNLVQYLKDGGYTNYKYASGQVYPTVEELKNGGYNVFIDNSHVWAVNPTVNEYFENGINLITIGNDSTTNLDIIKSATWMQQMTTYSAIEENLFTRRIVQSKVGLGTLDSRSAVKFVDDAEIFFTEETTNGTIYDAIGYLNRNGTGWIHSQVDYSSKIETLRMLIIGSLHYLSGKGIYYYEVSEPGTYTFDIVDNAGNVNTASYTWNVSKYEIKYKGISQNDNLPKAAFDGDIFQVEIPEIEPVVYMSGKEIDNFTYKDGLLTINCVTEDIIIQNKEISAYCDTKVTDGLLLCGNIDKDVF